MLIEELHNHLYLKSTYCDNLWSAYVPDQRTCELNKAMLLFFLFTKTDTRKRISVPECTIKPRRYSMEECRIPSWIESSLSKKLWKWELAKPDNDR